MATSVLVGLTKSGDVRLKYRRAQTEEVLWADFDTYQVIPADATAFVEYRSGTPLVARLVDLLGAGLLARVVVLSPHRDKTVVTAAVAATVRVAVDGPDAVPSHPAARLARYAPGGDPAALAMVVDRIFDPRWYVHPDRPNRTSRLESRFGLEPWLDGRAGGWRDVLVACWRRPDAGTEPPDVADFYGRLYDKHLAAGRSPHAAARKTGRHFLKALAACWTDALNAHGGEPMFDEKLLFGDDTVRAAREG